MEVDLHEMFHIDISDHDLMTSRSWRWLQLRVIALLSTESRLRRKLFPEKDKPPKN